jgi:hypothetical protein
MAGNVTQGCIDHALTLEARDTGKCRTLDFDGEMRFAAAVVAHVAMVAGGVVDDFEAGGCELCGQQAGDFLGYGSVHAFPSSASRGIWNLVQHDRFHGRREAQGRQCGWPDCEEPGEFRAPGVQPSGFDGPGSYRWFCLDHVRMFNAGYDYFAGMSSDEILRAQSPIHGWERETRAFSPTAGINDTPRWADFTDPLDAISARARSRMKATGLRQDGRVVTPDERRALDALGLPIYADRRALRTRYSELVRRYHPDRNGGDRSHEARLQGVVEAYQLLRRAAAFG